jgi:peroxiredoxin
MTRQAFILAVLAATLGIAAYAVYLGEREWMAPDFALQDVDGRAVRLSNFRGKVVFLNVWTTWCPPCRTEMPAMEALYQRLRDRDFVMLAVSADAEGRKVVAPFVQELGLTFPVLLDPDGQVPRRYRVTGYPETFIIDRNGRVVAHEVGPREWDDRRFEAALLNLIDSGAFERPG